MKLLRILSFAFLLQFNSVASAASVSNLGITKLVKCATLLTLGLSSPSEVSGDEHLRGTGVDRSLGQVLNRCPNNNPFNKLGRACNFEETCNYGEECCFKEVPGQGRCESTCAPELICDCLGGEFACRSSEFCMITTTDPTCECEGELIRCP